MNFQVWYFSAGNMIFMNHVHNRCFSVKQSL